MRHGRSRHDVVRHSSPLGLTLLLAFSAACSDSPVGVMDDAMRPFESGVSDRPFYAGAFLGDLETRPGSVGPAIARFTELTGRAPALVKVFFTLDADLSSGGWAGRVVREIAAVGSTCLIGLDLTWAGAPNEDLLSAVAGGGADIRLASLARGLADLGVPVLIEPGWEMNGDWNYPWQGVANGGGIDAAQRFVEAWRHLVVALRAGGATNVRFVFSPNIGNPVAGRGEGAGHWNWYGHYYPGDDYVDYVGAHGFHAPTLWGGGYRSFASLFDGGDADSLLSSLSARFPSKPILISEFAAEETPGHDKGRWIEQAYAFLERHPSVVGAVWFNAKKERDWRLDSSASALAGFRVAVDHPRVRARFESP